MKGIVLAGGSGTRLYPLTKATSKQLMPLYDKPMIYYSLSTLMLAGIKDILIITTPQDNENFKKLLGNGSDFGINLTYAIQDHPNGLAEAFIIGEDFIGSDSVALILGDNFFYGQHFSEQLLNARKFVETNGGGAIFGTLVSDPTAYGVVEFDENHKVLSIEEKPTQPKSNYAVPGLYFFDNTVSAKAKGVTPSARGEIEITSVIEQYLNEGKLNVELFGRGMAWLDTGTHGDLLKAANFVETVQDAQGLLIGSLEEIGYMNGITPTINQTTVRLSIINYTSALNSLFAGLVGVTSGSSIDTSKVQGNYRVIIEFIMQKGLNAAAGCGIAANIRGESNANPSAVSGDGYGSVGICQWTFGRKTNMINFVGPNWRNNLTGQLEFLWHELSTSYNRTVLQPLQQVPNNEAGARRAADIFVRKFEVPANVNLRSQQRQQWASDFWNQLVPQLSA